MTALTPPPGRFQLVPAMDPEHYAALYDDIKAAGVRVPIDIDEQGNILDGHHRKAIADELGKECPTRVVFGLGSDEAKEDYAITVNGARRQMSAERRRELATTSLKVHTRLSDREHSRRCGVSHTYIANLREVLELADAIEPAPNRQRRGGGEYPTDRLATVANRPDETAGVAAPAPDDGDEQAPDSGTAAVGDLGGTPAAAPDSSRGFSGEEEGTAAGTGVPDSPGVPANTPGPTQEVGATGAGSTPAPVADLRGPQADPERERERLKARDRDAGRTAASRLVPDIQTAVVSIGVAVKLGEPDLITAEMVRSCREAVDFLEAIFKGEA